MMTRETCCPYIVPAARREKNNYEEDQPRNFHQLGNKRNCMRKRKQEAKREETKNAINYLVQFDQKNLNMVQVYMSRHKTTLVKVNNNSVIAAKAMKKILLAMRGKAYKKISKRRGAALNAPLSAVKTVANR
uniref:Uncharacterized protein n=1 Tax=Plectus sambesii TaxID=2011161 RepID=A0A914W8J0_9BILA